MCWWSLQTQLVSGPCCLQHARLIFVSPCKRCTSMRWRRCCPYVMLFEDVRASAQASADQTSHRCRNDDNHAEQWHARTCWLSDGEPTAPLPRHGGDNAADSAGAAGNAEWTSARALQGGAAERQRQIKQKQRPGSSDRRRCAQHHRCAPDGKGQTTVCVRTTTG
jgi:hypothetical protein